MTSHHFHNATIGACEQGTMLLPWLWCLFELCIAVWAQPQSHGPQVGPHNFWPTVDLGYARYRPTDVNYTGAYYNFSNIRYAAPPIGDLRWRAPQDPMTDNRNVQDGSLGFICPQAAPLWFSRGNTALGNLSAVIPPSASSQTENEDCLFLDVIAPTKSFPARFQRKRLVPVLVNIHGGGFWIGEKRALYPPNGLFQAGDDNFIYVSINYRVTFPFSQCLEFLGLIRTACCLWFSFIPDAVPFEYDDT